MPIINIKQFNINSLRKQFSFNKPSNQKFSFEILFTLLIILGIPLNLYKNRFYDNSWTVGEWLISYAGGFVRRGLPGELIHFISTQYSLSPILLVWIFSVLSLVCLILLILYFTNFRKVGESAITRSEFSNAMLTRQQKETKYIILVSRELDKGFKDFLENESKQQFIPKLLNFLRQFTKKYGC